MMQWSKLLTFHGRPMRRLSTGVSKPPLVAMNSLTGRLDTFPSSSSPLKWYVCGPTVYDSAHLGHARSYVSQDILRRIVTQHFHQDIFLVMGMTDVDDKIIAAASAQQTSMANVARHHETAFLRNLAALNVLRVSSITRVSEHIPEIIGYIQGLDSNGFAYATSDGVYFDTVAMGSSYGKLAPSTPQEYTDIVLEDGAVGGEKRNVRDFALWKLSKTPDEPGWESPWGRGRPGWHIECSAMTHHVLGGSIDVHSGGVDLRFPHHNNEIAQCDAYHHHQADHTWCQHFVHFGHLYIKGLKMSKSLKNFITIDALLANYSADAFRLFCLQYKYNVNVHFSHDRMRDANAVYHRFHSFFHTLQSHVKATEAGGASEHARRVDAADFRVLDALAQCKLEVDSALRLDFDTPGALQHLLELVTATNKAWTDRPAMSVEVLCAVATYVMDTLALFGLDALRFPSLRLAAPVADDAASQSNAIQGADVMDVFTTFRAQVRALALTNTSDKVAQDILKLCDTVRDAQLPSLGIQIEDISPGKSFWKQQIDAVEDNTSTEKAVLAAKAAEFEAEMQVPPASFFQLSPQFAGKFTAFDHEGLPTHDADGTELTKTARKKLAKKLDKHAKSYEKYWRNK
ncbi:cysteine-tRNA ligase, variant 1 [Aphanomyces astaci]|uniref:cysteine--tRNA ligase n=1 Tax=Aphanomyces astaci TaxID=112090 RepID=W4H7B0_APHAT|nr:cysteine-tRNA ligase, variant 1 [Aphanomyces astaci]ETV87772.1 cysteine-tRNA ligase, variant 1 [Aphanomyces astaci]|eukprot:XP_009822635.1 cysteine-tRNA ligase, variant 1 [Aphanomyces astaci]